MGKVYKEEGLKITPGIVRLKNVLDKEEVINKYVTEICKEANISRSTYYRYMQDRGFVWLIQNCV